MKEVYDKIYGLYNEILKIPMDSPKYFELYKEYIKLLDKEAKENDWKEKAEVIINLIRKDEK